MGISDMDIDTIIKMLDSKTESGVSRINVQTSEEIGDGSMASVSHHGRCDVGSPWAKGTVTNSDCVDAPGLEEQDND